MNTLHSRLTDRLSAIRNQYDDTAVLARELVDVVVEWLASEEVGYSVLLSSAGAVEALIREAGK